ncbi:hypothetical protein B0T10DRAFT_317846 [Thelonectria olida]|uniref:Uncharacterized protein n=1 Tax=Thelonectria olida TaxID=1576542 RepID=A0A9P8W4X7_9HYPO|nr:hypothetical protein B0T10DRAFT_317846 [Thelonectria olida]
MVPEWERINAPSLPLLHVAWVRRDRVVARCIARQRGSEPKATASSHQTIGPGKGDGGPGQDRRIGFLWAGGTRSAYIRNEGSDDGVCFACSGLLVRTDGAMGTRERGNMSRSSVRQTVRRVRARFDDGNVVHGSSSLAVERNQLKPKPMEQGFTRSFLSWGKECYVCLVESIRRSHSTPTPGSSVYRTRRIFKVRNKESSQRNDASRKVLRL